MAAADENLLNSTRSTDFITPKSQVSKDFRNAVLTLARDHAFARALVNSGRLSVPAHLTASTLNTPDVDTFEGHMHPGAPMADAPVRRAGHAGRDPREALDPSDPADRWLLHHTGQRFVLMMFVDALQNLNVETRTALEALSKQSAPVEVLLVTRQDGEPPPGLTAVVDVRGVAAKRFDARNGTAYLLRPDQHVAARWRDLTFPQGLATVRTALQTALGHTASER